jgi:cell division protein FtsQ
LKARTRKKSRPKLPFRFRLIIGLILIIPIGIGIYFILSLPIWRISEVVVSGAKLLSAEEIRDLSGVPITENLFLTSFARVRNNLRQITAIKSFRIYRIPPATVYIRIEERKPVAVVLLRGKSAIIDEAGFVLNRTPGLTLNVSDMADLPVVSGVTSTDVSADGQINPQISRLITDIILDLAQRLGSPRIQLETGGFERITFMLDDLLKVKLGRDEEIRRKMEVFKALLKVIEGKWGTVEYVDVRYPDNPVIKYK